MLKLPIRLQRTLLAALLVAGCTGEEEAVRPIPLDVVVVENEAPPAASRLSWAMGQAPAFSIGTLEGDDAYQLFGVRDAAVLPDGSVAVANRGTGEIRVFMTDGTHFVSMGGIGEGPGEYRALEAVGPWRGDSIFGWDVRQQRISVFDADGNHGRTFRVNDFEDSFSPVLRGVTSDARLLIRAGFPQRDDAPYHGMFRSDRVYALVDGEGGLSTTLGAHPGEEGFLSAGGGLERFFAHPHGKSTASAVWGDHVLISPNDAYELHVFDLQGRLVKLVRMEHDPLPPTREDMLSWFDEFTANDTPQERADFRRTFDDMPLLDAFPAFETLVVDQLNYVWVRDYKKPGEDRATWVVFDFEGRVQGRVETPRGLEIYEIGADYLLGRRRGDLDIEFIEHWSLSR